MIFPYKASQEQELMLEGLDFGNSILLNAYTGSGKTIVFTFYGVQEMMKGKDIIFATFKHNNYIPIIKELKQVSFSSNFSISFAGIFGRNYMDNEFKRIYKKYFNPYEDSSYPMGVLFIKNSKIKIININHLINPDIFVHSYNRLGINPKESILVVDEAHNLFDLLIDNPLLFTSIKQVFSAFSKRIFISATFIPHRFFEWLLEPDNYIKIEDTRNCKLLIPSNISMDFYSRESHLEKIIDFLNQISKEKEVVAFFQNKKLINKIKNRISENIITTTFRGVLQESISLEGREIVAVGLPFPHKELFANINLLSEASSISPKELIYGFAATKIIQTLGRISRSPNSKANIYILDNRALKKEFLNLLPKAYSIEKFTLQ